MFEQLVKKGRNISDFDWYFKSIVDSYVCPHSGCGIGVERVIQFILASDDIRNFTLFPLNREILY